MPNSLTLSISLGTRIKLFFTEYSLWQCKWTKLDGAILEKNDLI